MKEFIINRSERSGPDNKTFIKELKHLGASVMDVYTGNLKIEEICAEVRNFLELTGIDQEDQFALWTGRELNDFRIIPLSDYSHWTIKFHDNRQRFVHIFPARCSSNTFRIKSNTLKSALIYNAYIGKDYITEADLNKARTFLDLSPVKEIEDSAAITGMIEILRENRE